MINKETVLFVSDSCGAIKVKCFNIFFKKKKSAIIGNLIKISIKTTLPLFKFLKKKKKNSAIIQTKFNIKKIDNSYIQFKYNKCVLFKYRWAPLGKYFIGPSIYNLNKKKLSNSFIITF